MRWASPVRPPTGWSSCPTARSSKKLCRTSSSATRGATVPRTSCRRSSTTDPHPSRPRDELRHPHQTAFSSSHQGMFTMKLRKVTAAAAAALVLSLTATACGGDDKDSDTGSGATDGGGTIKVGIKYDQPGLGLKEAG